MWCFAVIFYAVFVAVPFDAAVAFDAAVVFLVVVICSPGVVVFAFGCYIFIFW